MRILVLDAYHGGSHAAFSRGWARHSRHQHELLTLPAHHWKWRMRQAAIGFAQMVRERVAAGARWDLIVATDMLDLATFVGLAPASVAAIPRLVYFHENQLTYPVRRADTRDVHFAFMNITSCLVADAVVFNSAYHRDAFLGAVGELASRMPDHPPTEAAPTIRARAHVIGPGIDPIAARRIRGPREPGPLRVLWPHRWEHDKDPASFFAAIREARSMGAQLRLTILGQRFREAPPIFAQAEVEHADILDQWGYVDDHEVYLALVRRADVVVSTATHEFFGIAVMEAVAAGALPLVPPRLAYPETLGPVAEHPGYFYDGSVADLGRRLAEMARDPDAIWEKSQAGARVDEVLWPAVGERLDGLCDRVVAEASLD